MLEHVSLIKDDVDTFSQLLMCEGIMDVLNEYKSRYITEKYQLVIDATSFVIEILSKAISKPISVASYYHDLGYLEDVLTEDQIIARIKRALREAEEKRTNEIKIRSLHT
jgi:ribulose 1,5-bisphosphate synthetase/thiazole synthase